MRRSRCWPPAVRIDASRDRVRDDAARVAASSALRAQFDVARKSGARPRRAVRGQPRVEPDEFQAFVRADAGALARQLARLPARPEEAERARLRARARARRSSELAPDGTVRPAGHRDRYRRRHAGGVRGDGPRPEGSTSSTSPGGARRSSAPSGPGRSRPPASVALARNGERGTIVFTPVRTGTGERGFVAGTYQPPRAVRRVRRALRRTSGCASPAAAPWSARPGTCRATPSARGSPSAARRSTWPSPPRRSPACASARSRSASACC